MEKAITSFASNREQPNIERKATHPGERVGLFGGSFNPIHIGHLRSALEVREAFDLDRILLIPAALPPHKTKRDMAEPGDRLEMIRIAVSGIPFFTVSDVEVARPGVSYTIDTVAHFKSLYPPPAALFLVVGIDAFLEIDTWLRYPDLFEEIPFIIMRRPALGGKASWDTFHRYLSKITEGYSFSPRESCYVHARKQPLFPLDVSLLDISSTRIRAHIRQGKSVKFLVPESVEDYLKDKRLYL
jgi:nicotinate-nucleotide adenylyltransferase